jgi:uncharacterized membrane protein HdeD (DUF308 family)
MSTAPPPAPGSPLLEELHHLRDHWLLLFILGIGLEVVGTLSIIFSFLATIWTVTLLGTFLLAGAIIQVVNAVTCRNWRGFTVHLIGGILYGVVGMLMINHPVETAFALTLMVAATFIMVGIIRIIMAATDHFEGWPWVMLNGFISLFLGIYIWRLFPVDSFWLIGLFVGIEMLFAGMTWIFLAIRIRTVLPKRV